MNVILNPTAYMVISWCLFWGGWIGWPLTALTIARAEPPVVLGISWAALIYAAYGALGVSRLNKEVSTGCPHTCRDCAPPAAQEGA